MLRFDVTLKNWQVTVWQERSGAHSTQDSWLVDERNSSLRLAVVDGCTPMAASSMSVGVDGGVWAANVVRAALQSWRPAAECLEDANALLCDLTVSVTQARNQAAAIVADLSQDRLLLTQALDCEAWLEGEEGWRLALPGDAFAAGLRPLYKQWKEEHPTASSEEMQQYEESLLGRRSAWRVTAVGRFPEPLLASVELPCPRSLVLASDGARLDRQRLAALEDWLSGLRQWERRNLGPVAGGKPHDDVTVLWARAK